MVLGEYFAKIRFFAETSKKVNDYPHLSDNAPKGQ